MQADPYVSSNAPLEICSTTTTCTHVHTEPVNLFFFSIQSKLQEVGCLPPQCMFYTFDLIVQPILAYGSDVWHITTVGGTAVGEAFLFVRVVLHVNVTISNITTFGECDLVQSSVICSIHSVLRYVRTCKIRDLNIDLSVWIEKRAGQDQGGPRWDTLTKKSKSTKLLHIVLCYTQGVVAYDPVLFGGCIPPPLTPLQAKPEALILISIGGRTLQCGVMYIFWK